MNAKALVILFPGTNCELELIRALDRSGIKPTLVRWNEEVNFENFDAFLIPGGFSYEDRGRSGVVASKDPVLNKIRKESDKGKPVLGICNGAQILVESGIVPGYDLNPQIAIGWNERVVNKRIIGIGFYNDWIYIKSAAEKNRTPFNRFGSKVLMRIPVANGEGRYNTHDPKVLNKLIKNDQIVFKFCDNTGKIGKEFPVNPNNAMLSIAGICNEAGNAVSLMPHPERTLDGQPIFDSLADFFASRKLVPIKKNPTKIPVTTKILTQKKEPNITVLVKLKITDNEEKTIENSMKNYGYFDLKLGRSLYYGIDIKKGADAKKTAEKIIKSGELLNLNKENPTVIIKNKIYSYSALKGLELKSNQDSFGQNYYVAEIDNFLGANVKQKLNDYFEESLITNVEKGTHWKIELPQTTEVTKLIETNIFHNPNSMKITALKN